MGGLRCAIPHDPEDQIADEGDPIGGARQDEGPLVVASGVQHVGGGDEAVAEVLAASDELGQVERLEGALDRGRGVADRDVDEAPLAQVDRELPPIPDLAADAEGPEVRGAQCLLGDAGFRPADAEPTGVIDPDTAAQVEALQTDRGLEATGEIDPATWTALLSSGATPTLQNGDRGSAVIRLQRTLTAALGQELPIDGIFGDDVEAAVRDYQSSRGLGVDGVAGAETWEAMQAGS